MFNLHLGFYKHKYINNSYVHRSLLKIIVNPILRVIQFYTLTPWVITSEVTFINSRPIFKTYKLGKMQKLGSFSISDYDVIL